EKLGQGRENYKVFLEENPKILEEIIDKTYEFYGLRSKEDSEAIKTENNDDIKDESNNEISEDELD
ncbi:MAG: DNA recombination/repair protein RecA, partial [Finegoldia magna]|nr:DNA recombination/repair protein RecA [Finegoldia magna]